MDAHNTSIAPIAYLTPVGLIIAWFSEKKRPNAFLKFHIRQSLGLYLIGFIYGVLTEFLWGFLSIPILSIVMYVGIVTLLLLGIMAAAEGSQTPVPIVGSAIQKILKRI
ncbi:MAG: hypothetical protein R3359_10265 [Marinirhabdus sp.]|nr:hypothetical protein [Marinirhabdus sp.]